MGKNRESIFRMAAAALAALFIGLGVASVSQASVVMPLRTQGSLIVDSAGKEVVLQGVNWFGFETETHAPHGLWARDYKDMLIQIRSQGFNTIRLPFLIEALES